METKRRRRRVVIDSEIIHEISRRLHTLESFVKMADGHEQFNVRVALVSPTQFSLYVETAKIIGQVTNVNPGENQWTIDIEDQDGQDLLNHDIVNVNSPIQKFTPSCCLLFKSMLAIVERDIRHREMSTKGIHILIDKFNERIHHTERGQVADEILTRGLMPPEGDGEI